MADMRGNKLDKWSTIIAASRSLVIGATLVLAACVSESSAPMYSFEFNTWTDSPGVEVLDYRYGDSKQPGVRPSEEALRLHQVGQNIGTYGPMPRAQSLYVKWRIRKTGEVYEDNVDLKQRLPKDLEHVRVRLAIEGPQLYVFVVFPEKVKGHCPENASDPSKHVSAKDSVFLDYCYQKVSRIYPDKVNVPGEAE